MEFDSQHFTRLFHLARSSNICCADVEGQGEYWSYCHAEQVLTDDQIVYDLHQLPSEALAPLRDSLLSLLQNYVAGPRPIRTRLCICLASLAIQMTAWKNVIQTVGSTVGNSPQGLDCLLDFLTILPEEVTEGRKINLTVCATVQPLIFSFAAFAAFAPLPTVNV